MKSMTNGGFGITRPAPPASPRRGKAVRVLSAVVLLYGAALSASGIAYAAPGGGGGGGHMGGGGSGGGMHMGGGGFGGGMHMGGGGFGGGMHAGGFSGGLHAGAAGAVHAGGLGGGFHTGAVGTLEGSRLQPHEAAGFGSSGVRPDIAGGAEADRLHAGSSQPEPGGNSIVMRGNERGVQWHHGWHNGQFGWWQGYDPYLWSYGDSYGLNGTDEAQSGYYCSDPAGYYPAVTQCNSAWQIVSGN